MEIKFGKLLNFNHHIDEVTSRANRIKSELKKELELIIHKTIIRPNMTYGSEIIFINENKI